MSSSLVESAVPPKTRSAPGAMLFVWGIWAAMVAIAVWHFAHYARNLPLAEDWNLVRALTGNEPDLGEWLWSQNNEHRLPFPRLVMLGLLKVSGGDFRSGMILNITMVALLAAAMIEVARRGRGGLLRYTDAVFPVLLLEVGDWQNLFWHWQVAFVLSIVLVSAGLLAIIRRPSLETPGAAWTLAAALALAPLTGGSGLVFLPPLMLYAGWRGVVLARGPDASKAGRRAAVILLGAVIVSTAIIVVYLAGYERPEWVPENPGLIRSLHTAVQFQTFGLGPAVRTSWKFWSAVALLLLLAAAVRAGLAVLYSRRSAFLAKDDRLRATGLIVCLLSVAGAAAAIGWGRAAVIDVYHGWPDRYVLLAAPAFCLTYFAWELPSVHATSGRLGRGLLFALAILLLPMNVAFGREWGSWYVGGMDRVVRDIRAGTPRDVLAARHGELLYHSWEPPVLAEHMQMLHDRGIGPFAAMVIAEDNELPANLDTVTVRYHLPEAGAVQLVWWFKDGSRVPVPIRPPGTTTGKRGTAVTTPMERLDSVFAVTLRIPSNDSLEYGFMITGRNDGDTIIGVWDGVRQYQPDSRRGTTMVDEHPTVSLLTDPLAARDTALVQQTIRYGPTDARAVRVIWGIDDWQRLPADLWPAGTRVTANHMTLTRMRRTGSMFNVTLPVPVGRRLDFAFQVDRADRFEISDDNHGRNFHLVAVGDSAMTIAPGLNRVTASRLGTVLMDGIRALVIVGMLAVLSSLAGKVVTRAGV